MTSKEEFDFANDARAAVLQRIPWSAWLQILIIAALLAAAFGWAMFARLDEVTHAVGRVIPSSQLQVVQTIEPAIVKDLLVREGQVVDKGQVLMRLDNTAQLSRAGELRQKRFALMAEIARLEAEIQLADEIAIPANANQQLLGAVMSEQATLTSRLGKLVREQRILQTQLEQRQQELKELEATRDKLGATLSPLRKETQLTRDLNTRGFVPDVELLRLVRQEADVEGQMRVTEAALPRAQSAISEAAERLEIAEAVFKSEALERLAKAKSELAIAVETERDLLDRLNRTSLRAPVRGVVNKVSVTSIGAIVRPGEDIVSLVPIDDRLEIEARIRPQDVAFIREGQNANVKLTAYDFSVYGFIPGQVKRLSADTLTDNNGEAFYRAIVSTDKSHIEHNGKRLPILPGMQASVDILTGEKTVLEYLTKPLARLRNEALREN